MLATVGRGLAAALLGLGLLGFAGGVAAGEGQQAQKYSNARFQMARSFRAAAPLLRDIPAGNVVESKTTRVDVYPSGALIERTGSVVLTAGEQRIVVPALPEGLQAASLHVSGFGAGAVAGSTFLESGTLIETRPPELVELEETLRTLEARERVLAASDAALLQRREFLIENGKRLTADGLPSVDALRQTLDFATAELEAIDAKRADIAEKRLELAPDLEQYRREHQELRARLERPVKHVVIEVTAKEARELPLVIRYFVTGPSWTPRHVARYDTNSGELTLETYAWVVQETGEAWENVTLHISTARPAEGLMPPQAPAPQVWLEEGRQRVAGEVQRLGEQAGFAAVGGSAGLRDFAPAGAVTVASNARGRRILLETTGVQTEARRVAVPRINPAVYLLLSLRNERMTALLPGEASLFNGTDYVGTAALPAALPGEAIVLPFGRDAAVTVARTRVARDSGGDGRRQELRYRYQFQAQNRLGRDVAVEVREDLPTTDDRRAKVTLTPPELRPIPAGRGESSGTLTWLIQLPAGGNQSWDLAYTVAAPGGLRVMGAD